MSIELRRARSDELAAIETMLAGNDWGVARYELGEWFVARDDGEIVGVAHATDVDDETRYVDDLVVVGARRGRGIGADLMRHVMADRAAHVYLVCHEPRIAFYERLGFELVEESAIPEGVRDHAYRTDDLPSVPDHVHHLMRRVEASR